MFSLKDNIALVSSEGRIDRAANYLNKPLAYVLPCVSTFLFSVMCLHFITTNMTKKGFLVIYVSVVCLTTDEAAVQYML